ncbi:DUF362 domain-containing protein [Desulfogranum mediterraneum]|uniref:DUF362 domain-containing protein n=1 Tax=Desulfogranum mediterraneum TaxID=160661 RepID=UPI000410D576|nr:DUF362 domain-containing protein [Desulfogranum mediterraneum]
MDQGTVFSSSSQGADPGLSRLLDAAGLPERIGGQDVILIKPNLVEALPPPITTPVELVAALVRYLRKRSAAEIIIAEGTAALHYETDHCFAQLGYTRLAAELRVPLLDLNQEPSVALSSERCLRWPRMQLPRIALESFLLSVPVLKAHTLARVTLTMKNMMGLPPPDHYQQGGGWKKSAFHGEIHAAIADLNRYRSPDFTLLDASTGMAEAHLWGRHCQPPVGRLVASADPVATDAYGAELLGKDWQEIDHIRMVHRELGQASPLRLVEVDSSRCTPNKNNATG